MADFKLDKETPAGPAAREFGPWPRHFQRAFECQENEVFFASHFEKLQDSGVRLSHQMWTSRFNLWSCQQLFYHSEGPMVSRKRRHPLELGGGDPRRLNASLGQSDGWIHQRNSVRLALQAVKYGVILINIVHLFCASYGLVLTSTTCTVRKHSAELTVVCLSPKPRQLWMSLRRSGGILWEGRLYHVGSCSSCCVSDCYFHQSGAPQRSSRTAISGYIVF